MKPESLRDFWSSRIVRAFDDLVQLNEAVLDGLEVLDAVEAVLV